MTHERHAIAMVETVMATAMVGLLLVVSLRSLSFATHFAQRQSAALQAGALAESLAFEMLAKQFSESTTSGHLGPDSGETDRSEFDDFDDYHGLVLNPIRDADGSQLLDFAGWSGAIQVTAVDPENLEEVTPGAATRLKLAKLKFQSPAGEVFGYQIARGQGYLPATISPSFDAAATAIKLQLKSDDEIHSRVTPVYTHPVIPRLDR
ncbi:MAG TPA: hypothetical protein DDW52_17115 [Planctomycetaceae bacterium]|nr:hypothetical protein [Planctomycetaceae bacterium]